MAPNNSPVQEKNRQEQSGRNTIANLRLQDKSYKYSVRRMVESFLRSLSSFSLAVKSDKLHNKMCENYGHIADNQKWEHGRPLCRDCGAVIRDSDELRKSTLK